MPSDPLAISINSLFALTTFSVVLYTTTANQLSQLWQQYRSAREELTKAHRSFADVAGFDPLTVVVVRGQPFALHRDSVWKLHAPASEAAAARKIPDWLADQALLLPPDISIEPWDIPPFPWEPIAKRLVALSDAERGPSGEYTPIVGYLATLVFMMRIIRKAEILRRNKRFTSAGMWLTVLVTVAMTTALSIQFNL